nr:MBL fold metallo-hydrolase [Rhizobium sp. ACO-34A]
MDSKTQDFQNQPATSIDKMKVTVWGTRGSIPVSGPHFSRYGGNTTCVELRCGNEVLIFDCGTGIIPAGARLKAERIANLNLFLTHSHYDHIMGFPFFGPFHCPDVRVSVWSGHLEGNMTTRQIVEGLLRPPYFPVGLEIMKASLTFRDFLPGDILTPVPGIVMRTAKLTHPGGAVGYRIEWQGKIFALITDTEHIPGVLDPNVLSLIDHADLFLYDSTFGDEDMEHVRGIGHSSWQQAIRLAEAANTASVGFIHHAFTHTDDDIDDISARARQMFPSAHVFSDGQSMEI